MDWAPMVSPDLTRGGDRPRSSLWITSGKSVLSCRRVDVMRSP